MVKIAAWENGIELYQLLSGIEYATVKTMEEAKARPMFVSAIQMKNFIYILSFCHNIIEYYILDLF